MDQPGLVIARRLQSLSIADEDGLSQRLNESLFRPSGYYPTDCEYCCASHLGKFLSAKRDLNSSLGLFANLAGQPEKHQGQSSRHIFGYQFTKSFVQFLYPGSKNSAEVLSKLRIFGYQALQSPVFPYQSLTVLR